ncbi:PTS system mannitol-specific IIB component [Erysipelotrichaceae bacterium]|nr:PTS system mannitol-specific IIB component [Erysipelotrichaceae bacterium]
MLKIITVCGNGIGSSLMLRLKVEEICAENGIAVDVESCDFNSVLSKQPDLIITVAELAKQLPAGQPVAVVRSYINKKKIQEDALEKIREMAGV